MKSSLPSPISPLASSPLWYPKYWATWCLVGLLYLLVQLPHRIRLVIGSGMGALFYRLASYRVLVAKTNIDLCFPEKTAAERQALLQAHFRAVGQGLIESAMGWFLSKRRLLKRLVDFPGHEHLVAALQTDRPIIFLGLHSTGVDVGSAFIAKDCSFWGLYRPAKNPVFDYVIQRGRARHFHGMLAQSDLRGMLRALERGEHVWYAADQDFGTRAKGVFAPFFGVSAYTITVFAKLAQKTDAIILPAAAFRLPDGNYSGYYLASLDLAGLDDTACAQAMNQALETLIRPFPAQYYWLHRRFKTRPDGEAALYPEKPRRR